MEIGVKLSGVFGVNFPPCFWCEIECFWCEFECFWCEIEWAVGGWREWVRVSCGSVARSVGGAEWGLGWFGWL